MNAEAEAKLLIQLSVDCEELEVENLRSTLEVSQLFCFWALTLPSSNVELEAIGLLGKNYVLTVTSELGESLVVHGVVGNVSANQDGDSEGYLLELYPRAHLRTSRRNHRVFQNSTVRAVLTELLTKSGSDIGKLEWALSQTYPTRPYVVQSGETDWEFATRLMADEGIHYFFRFDEHDTVLVFSDDSTGAPAIVGPEKIPVRDATLLRTEAAIVQSHHRRSITTGRVRIKDYDPQQPTAKLDVTETFGSTWREHYDAPGRFAEAGEGKRRATNLGDALRVEQSTLQAQTNVLRLTPGRQFTLSEHEFDAFNIPYFVTGVTLLARQDLQHHSSSRRQRKHREGLMLNVRAIPLASPYRSPVPGPKVAPGPQTAVVVGPTGEEIHTDDKGHARTQFYWDREGKHDQTACTWMRVGQFPLAGSMMLPRIHWDQMVGFTAGDVDSPVVQGHLYDSVAKVPYALPANKTRTAWQTATTPSNGSANEIRYEDKAGGEEIFLNASYDMTYEVGHDSSTGVGVDQKTEIGVNQTWSVGNNQKMTVIGAQEVSVGAVETLTVSGGRTCNIGGNDSETVGVARMVTTSKGATLEADGNRSLTAGALMMTVAAMGVERMTVGKSSITVGGAWISAAGAEVGCVTAGKNSEMVGGAKIQVGGKGINTEVGGKAAQTVGGAFINVAGKNFAETSEKSFQIDVGGAYVVTGPDVLIEAETKLVIKVGGTTVTMTKGKIHIKAPNLVSPGATIAKSGSTVDHNP